MARGKRRSGRVLSWALPAVLLVAGGCARLPYTTRVIQDDPRVRVTLQRMVDDSRFSHPVELAPQDLMAILRGVSLRAQRDLPLRWFSEETPPLPAFREDELLVLAPALSQALKQAGPGERVYWELLAPGLNPAYFQEVTSGWVAVRDRFLHVRIDYFHHQNPSTQFDHYNWYYPTPPFPPGSFVLYFEPGRFWVQDPEMGTRGVDFREFLRSAPVPQAKPPAPLR